MSLLLALIAALYLFNASWRVAPGRADVRLIAHRGVHQTYSRTGLERDTCTATRIHPPTHDFIENTVRSMRAAFAAGADVVELDVHPTTDGYLAVFHDWTLDCRTDGSGEVRAHDLAYLKSLDVGHGYTADGGRSFPLRGHGVGLMPDLGEVLSTFPDGRFLINFKSREAREGDMLASLVNGRLSWRSRLWGVYGGGEPTSRAAALLDDGLRHWTRRGLVRCLGAYIAYGWTGLMPDACRSTVVMVPVNVAPWLWGWPNLFQERLRAVGSDIVLTGPIDVGDPGTVGIDSLADLAAVPPGFAPPARLAGSPNFALADLAAVPPGFAGYLWTNRIEVIGPALRR